MSKPTTGIDSIMPYGVNTSYGDKVTIPKRKAKKKPKLGSYGSKVSI